MSVFESGEDSSVLDERSMSSVASKISGQVSPARQDVSEEQALDSQTNAGDSYSLSKYLWYITNRATDLRLVSVDARSQQSGGASYEQTMRVPRGVLIRMYLHNGWCLQQLSVDSRLQMS